MNRKCDLGGRVPRPQDRGSHLKLPFARRALPLTGGGVLPGCLVGASEHAHNRSTGPRHLGWSGPARPHRAPGEPAARNALALALATGGVAVWSGLSAE